MDRITGSRIDRTLLKNDFFFTYSLTFCRIKDVHTFYFILNDQTRKTLLTHSFTIY